MNKVKFKKNDVVIVVNGKDKGKTGHCTGKNTQDSFVRMPHGRAQLETAMDC